MVHIDVRTFANAYRSMNSNYICKTLSQIQAVAGNTTLTHLNLSACDSDADGMTKLAPALTMKHILLLYLA